MRPGAPRCLCNTETQVQSPAWHNRLRIQCCHGYDIGQQLRFGSDSWPKNTILWGGGLQKKKKSPPGFGVYEWYRLSCEVWSSAEELPDAPALVPPWPWRPHRKPSLEAVGAAAETGRPRGRQPAKRRKVSEGEGGKVDSLINL